MLKRAFAAWQCEELQTADIILDQIDDEHTKEKMGE
jgi:hypothetical protein